MGKAKTKSDVFEKFKDERVFLKESSKSDIDGAQKAALNRKGNVCFNSGDIENARRIFITTGYSDGISRVGDCYKSKGRLVDALRMYVLANDKKKSDCVCAEFSTFISGLLREDEGLNGNNGT
ncbi:MAG: hypothetical protein LBS82_00320 [Spirochaetaceae bacterium]|jgi:hypothetical protein|nr:hypothetical protein [Spirochaetaceae bacterium]